MLFSFKRMGIAAILIGTILVVVYAFLPGTASYFQTFLSSDGVISPGEHILKSVYLLVVFLVLAIGIVFIKAENAVWRTRMMRVFWDDLSCRTLPDGPLLVGYCRILVAWPAHGCGHDGA